VHVIFSGLLLTEAFDLRFHAFEVPCRPCILPHGIEQELDVAINQRKGDGGAFD
jgi:hypothetical protein